MINPHKYNKMLSKLIGFRKVDLMMENLNFVENLKEADVLVGEVVCLHRTGCVLQSDSNFRSKSQTPSVRST